MIVTKPLPRISMAGTGAMLVDASQGLFDEQVQRRIWASAALLSELPWVDEAVPGMNNLMVVFDPLVADRDEVSARILECWGTAPSEDLTGQDIVVPVAYGGVDGADLAEMATHAGLTVEEVVALHAGGTYTVAAVGSMPGFPYLSGLDPRIARPRMPIPRTRIPRGAVIIGGTHTGIMPCAAPSGWHIIGKTDVSLFDAHRSPPSLLHPGDRLRFQIIGLDT